MGTFIRAGVLTRSIAIYQSITKTILVDRGRPVIYWDKHTAERIESAVLCVLLHHAPCFSTQKKELRARKEEEEEETHAQGGKALKSQTRWAPLVDARRGGKRQRKAEVSE